MQAEMTTFLPKDVQPRASIDMKAGDTVRVWSKIEEKGKIRLQAFEGIVLARKHGSEPGATFTVRKVSSGIGVERIFPLYSPTIDSIEILKRSKVRQSKLYYIRNKAAKEIRKKLKALQYEAKEMEEVPTEEEVKQPEEAIEEEE